MKQIKMLLPTLLAVMYITGCSINHEYTWKEYEANQQRISFTQSTTSDHDMDIIKGESDNSRKLLGSHWPHYVYGSYQTATNGLAEQLAIELRKRDFVIKDGAPIHGVIKFRDKRPFSPKAGVHGCYTQPRLRDSRMATISHK
jgi:hypothetical protein